MTHGYHSDDDRYYLITDCSLAIGTSLTISHPRTLSKTITKSHCTSTKTQILLQRPPQYCCYGCSCNGEATRLLVLPKSLLATVTIRSMLYNLANECDLYDLVTLKFGSEHTHPALGFYSNILVFNFQLAWIHCHCAHVQPSISDRSSACLQLSIWPSRLGVW